MFDESQGTLRLNRDDLGDERVPSLTLTQLREAYQAGTGSLRSWTTEGLFGSGNGWSDGLVAGVCTERSIGQ